MPCLRTWGSLFILLASAALCSSSWTADRKLAARDATGALWRHGFDSYMKYAFPLDELAPLTCSGRGPDWNDPRAIHYNDVNANISLTLIDNLDSFVVLRDREGFHAAVQDVIQHVSFNVNTKPQVFEITIRALGGLLSGHLFASDRKYGYALPGYRGELLDLARDLGERLLPAFDTPTGIPYARINLNSGVQLGESFETCSAGAGSLLLEFGALSRWTGDFRFDMAAKKAFFAVWNRRSALDLIGNGINLKTGAWIEPTTSGVGAGIDSFFEYALKMYLLTGETEFFDVWEDSYSSLMKYSRGDDGFWFRTVEMTTGAMAYQHIDSLGAFWPGLQVLSGDIESGIKSHLAYWNLWSRFGGMPETFNILTRQAISLGYPLRPEFVESNYFLYLATKDSFYLDVGETILADLTNRTKVQCGLATISNLLTGTNEDRMESFALSETLKYLYLLFDEDNPINKASSPFVFTTEGHLLTLEEHDKHTSFSVNAAQFIDSSRPSSRYHSYGDLRCTPYQASRHAFDVDWHDKKHETLSPVAGGLVGSIIDRGDFEYASLLAGSQYLNPFGEYNTTGSPLAPALANRWDHRGWCHVPLVDEYTYEWILSHRGEVVLEDSNPSAEKIQRIRGGFLLHNVTGLRVTVTSRLDRTGYDITRIGPYKVSRGEKVFVNDPIVSSTGTTKTTADKRLPDVILHLHSQKSQPTHESVLPDAHQFPILNNPDPNLSQAASQDNDFASDNAELPTIYASTGTFGGNPGIPRQTVPLASEAFDAEGDPLPSPLIFSPQSPVNHHINVVMAEDNNLQGCELSSHLLPDPPEPGTSNQPREPQDSLLPAVDRNSTPTVLFVNRGNCTFLTKLWNAKQSGFVGVIAADVANEFSDHAFKTTGGSGLINPSIDESERAFADEHLMDVAIVVVSKADGMLIEGKLRRGQQLQVGVSRVEDDSNLAQQTKMLGVKLALAMLADKFNSQALPSRHVTINGIALRNTIIL